MAAPTDREHAILFEHLRSILSELYDEVTKCLALLPKSTQPLDRFSSPDGSVTGSLLTFTGKEVDLLIYSWLHAPQRKFSTMRLTIWLSPLIEIPHLAFEFGTIPNPFFYIDYVPRVDLWTDPSYAERYYEPVNSTYLSLRDNPNLSLFVSKELYVRQFQSPVHLCFTCPATEDSLSLIRTTSYEMYSRWSSWVKQAKPIPIDARAALAERDLRMRRISAERDPGNAMATKIFGAELSAQLVRALWSLE
ncbi:red chlorophyll catabolite reductase [Pleurocapsales cyanobacterium LEGE 06147]|nr:red chlorophyll catabolite reductase [Pleurocapsales cyanobacterium LEGE 06147]